MGSHKWKKLGFVCGVQRAPEFGGAALRNHQHRQHNALPIPTQFNIIIII